MGLMSIVIVICMTFDVFQLDLAGCWTLLRVMNVLNPNVYVD